MPTGRYVLASACRPTSVIVSQVTLIGRPPAYMVPGVGVARPSSTKLPKVSTVKPCASKIASVHPSGEPASTLSARCNSTPTPRFRGLTATARRSGCAGDQMDATAGLSSLNRTTSKAPCRRGSSVQETRICRSILSLTSQMRTVLMLERWPRLEGVA
jgi:hypothetical protein